MDEPIKCAIFVFSFIVIVGIILIKIYCSTSKDANKKAKDCNKKENAKPDSGFKPRKRYYDNGNLLSEQRTPYHFILYYPNGSINQEIRFVDKKLTLTCFSEEGNVWFVSGVFLIGGNSYIRLSGQAQSYYSNGHLKCVGKYKEGKLNGKMDYFYENGNLLMTLNFRDDVPISGVIYTLDGKEKELTVAHINNIIVDYGLGSTDIDLSWVKELCMA